MNQKLVLATLCVLLGACSAGSLHLHASKDSGRSLVDDLMRFVTLIPQDEVLSVFLEYLANDPEVEATLTFMSSPRYIELIDTESHAPMFAEYLQFFEDSGLPAYDLWNQYRASLGLEPLPKPSTHKSGVPRGMLELVDAILAILDPEPFQDLFKQLLVESAEFKAFADRLFSAAYDDLMIRFLSDPQIAAVMQELKDNGLDIITIDNRIRDHFRF